jgi:hypothetical protein
MGHTLKQALKAQKLKNCVRLANSWQTAGGGSRAGDLLLSVISYAPAE